MAADAPETFRSLDAAKCWLRTPEAEAVKWGGAPNRDSLGAPPHLIATTATARMLQQRGRATPLLVLSDRPLEPLEARQRAEAVLGQLTTFELLDSPALAQEAAPEAAQAAPVAHIQRPNRPRHRMEPWPLPPGKSKEEAMAELWAGLLASKRWLEERRVAAAPSS